MTRLLTTTLFVIFISIIDGAKLDCPNPVCDCSIPETVNCASKRLDRVPTFSTDDAATQIYNLINLSHNLIFTVQPLDFKDAPARTIDLSDNPLIGISPRAFYGCEEVLEKLDLHETGLSVIHWAVFEKLFNLKQLNLANNDFLAVQPEHFQNLLSLQELDLSFNRLRILKSNSFEHLVDLKTLNLRGNRIQTIEEETFKNLGRLHQLELSNNKLTTTSDLIFRGLVRLTELNLSDNKISTLPYPSFKSSLKSMQKLNLNNNNLSQIANQTFSSLSKLSSLSLSGNNISYISQGAFSGLSHLGTLDLSSNAIRTLGGDCSKMEGTEYLITLKLNDNPLNCTCQLLWTHTLVANGATVMGLCVSPPEMSGDPLAAINFTLCSRKPECE